MLNFAEIWFLTVIIVVLVILLTVALIASNAVRQKKRRVNQAKVSSKRVTVNEDLFINSKDS